MHFPTHIAMKEIDANYSHVYPSILLFQYFANIISLMKTILDSMVLLMQHLLLGCIIFLEKVFVFCSSLHCL